MATFSVVIRGTKPAYEDIPAEPIVNHMWVIAEDEDEAHRVATGLFIHEFGFDPDSVEFDTPESFLGETP
jgi:hypothetical protein